MRHPGWEKRPGSVSLQAISSSSTRRTPLRCDVASHTGVGGVVEGHSNKPYKLYAICVSRMPSTDGFRPTRVRSHDHRAGHRGSDDSVGPTADDGDLFREI